MRASSTDQALEFAVVTWSVPSRVTPPKLILAVVTDRTSPVTVTEPVSADAIAAPAISTSSPTIPTIRFFMVYLLYGAL